MKPYYQDDLVTLYHGDCREWMPTLKPDDAILTDPPYGIDYDPLHGGNGSKMWGRARIHGDDGPFDPAFLLGHPSILWGANHYANRLPASGGWLVWDKTPRGIRGGFIASHAELAWTNLGTRVHKFALEWQGNLRNGEGFHHPTQKPVALMRWCIGLLPDDDDQLILDPFCGSGSTLVAAKEMGRRAVGIEIDERWCERAAVRCSQEVLGLLA